MSHRILVIHSNPADSSRLRLDREHRALEEVIRSLKLDRAVQIAPAATIPDLIHALREPSIRIVQFSGHGSTSGIYLEASEDSDAGTELRADQLRDLILANAPDIHALILASCYSAEIVDTLIEAAPYVITINGPADDVAAIEFTRNLYEAYFSRFNEPSIDYALTSAKASLKAQDLEDALDIVVNRRGPSTATGRDLVKTTIGPSIAHTIVYVDVSDLKTDLDAIGLSSGQFRALLADRISVHNWIGMASERTQYAVLSIGKYFGVFSWTNGLDIIQCRELVRPKDSAKQDQCTVWMYLSFDYSRLFRLQYRNERQAVYAGMEQKLAYAIEQYGRVMESIFDEPIRLNGKLMITDVLDELIPTQSRLSLPLLNKNFKQAKSDYESERFSDVILHLESCLSILHGLLDGLKDELCETG